MILDKINQAGDIRKLKESEYEELAREIRRFLIKKISVSGGHLASNLGVVELTMALHLVFDPSKDKIVWDVGHQSYTHKILTGRRAGFDELRKYGGMSGFPKRKESQCDPFDTGHSSTSISAGMGLAMARDRKKEDYSVISVIGDGALTGGMALEALNNVSSLDSNYIIILNDNEMSISRNTGGISEHLGKIRRTSAYYDLKEHVTDRLEQFPGVGRPVLNALTNVKNNIKKVFIPGMLFENMGITYWGPVDGHDIKGMVTVLENAKRLKKPVLIHVLTKKGKGYRPAEEHPERFHGVSPFDIRTGQVLAKKTEPDWTDVFSKTICEAARENQDIVAVTAAMPDGTGLTPFAREFPDRFFDAGIAEQHAVTFAAGMAAGGLKPVVAVYSSFLQRAYDQIIHDVCIQNLPVVFAVDRAGLVGSDGETHQGIFDLSYLSHIPNMTVCAPKNIYEFQDMLNYAFTFQYPIAIRYPRGTGWKGLAEFRQPIAAGEAEWIYEESGIALLAVGSMVETAVEVRSRLKELGYAVSLINMRFVSPIDDRCLTKVVKNHSLLVTMEENVLKGGFGEHVCTWLEEAGSRADILNAAVPDIYVEHGNVDILKNEIGLDADFILKRILERIGEQE
ncbi:MAG: 1-deoxy-D-xylulose-5-phosphate synthase [Lachnospiraceae bacterium]|nr:1-deoxy-D-xylulose-5-phosphate synthase [Lachnospiraceae bacterium]